MAHAVATQPWTLLVAERERLAVQFAEVCGVTAAMRLGDREHGAPICPGSKITALVLGWVENSVVRSDSQGSGVAGSFLSCVFASIAW